MPKVYIRTYGCQMNERDSEQVAQMFTEGGYTVTGDETDADAILVNTCSVRDQAEQKALGKMGNMGSYRRNKPHVVFGFMGCMAQSRGPELFERIPHLDVVVGTQTVVTHSESGPNQIPPKSVHCASVWMRQVLSVLQHAPVCA